MRKLIGAINMTLDGFCDHTAMIADDQLHENFNELFASADTILYGRVTYQLMESAWPAIVKNPTGIQHVDEFAVLIDQISKIVFSNTLKTVEWKNTRLAEEELKQLASKLKQQPGKDILAGGRSILIALMQENLIDEFQFFVHPIVLGSGLPLFSNIKERMALTLVKTKTLDSGVVILYYVPTDK